MATPIELEQAYQERAGAVLTIKNCLFKQQKAACSLAETEGLENIVPHYLWPQFPSNYTYLQAQIDLFGQELYFNNQGMYLAIYLTELEKYTNTSSRGLQKISLHRNPTLLSLPSVPAAIFPLFTQMVNSRIRESREAAIKLLFNGLTREDPPLLLYIRNSFKNNNLLHHHREDGIETVFLPTKLDHVDVALYYRAKAKFPEASLIIQDLEQPRLAKI